MKKKGILLINLGTPSHCEKKAVAHYLREFLQDYRVVDLPWPIRWSLVNLLIVPFRSYSSTKAYQKIWSQEGSPLLVNSRKLQQALSMQLGMEFVVELGMRYGEPSIAEALTRLSHCQRITVIPLFPQYSSAATGSALECVLKSIAKQINMAELHIINHFFQDPGYISAYASIINETLQTEKFDLLLFSYHGLPERHLLKSQCLAACDHLQSCPSVEEKNSYCYRAQCYATSRLLAQQLGLQEQQYQVSFQSRLGRTPWIKPYTDLMLPRLLASGVKNIAVVCPSFVADCLETLEEINIRAREQWQMLGGKNFIFIPCLNAHPQWVDTVVNWSC